MTLHPTAEETYGESVRRRRLEAGLTQDELADAVSAELQRRGMDAGFCGPDAGASISRIERGTRVPRFRTQVVLEAALDRYAPVNEREQRLLRIAQGVIRMHRQMIIERRIAPAGWMQLVNDAQRELKRIERDEPAPTLKVVDGS